MPEVRVGIGHIWTVPGKAGKRDQLAIKEHTNRPNPPIVARPSFDDKRWRSGRAFPRFFNHAEWRLILTAQGVPAISTPGARGGENGEELG
jgi:hypothetical protein